MDKKVGAMKKIAKVRRTFEWEGLTLRLCDVSQPHKNSGETVETLMALAPNNGVIKCDFKRGESLKSAAETTIKFLDAGMVPLAGLDSIKVLFTRELSKNNPAYCHE